MSVFRSALAALIVMAGPVSSHEFWISPVSYVIANGEEMQADIRVGQNFTGSAYAYNPKRHQRFDLVQNGKLTAVTGRLGDTPALTVTAANDTLAIIIHETTDNLLSYKEWAKFVKFATHKDVVSVLYEHGARGLPQDMFTERYRRFAKSLVAVGNGAGEDMETGLRTEIVALTNPYTTTQDIVTLRVFYEGTPRSNTQLELFERAPDGTVEITLHRTDESGMVDVPIKRDHQYLADAVKMVALDTDDPANKPVWYSLWAGLTFAVPAQPLTGRP